MRPALFAAATAMALATAACSGTGDGNTSNASNTASANESAAASFDPNSTEGQAYRALLECAATNESAKSQIGGESTFKQGAERQQFLARENALRTRAAALQARAIEQGVALGLTEAQVEEQFNAHVRTFVHGPGLGTREEYALQVAGQADSCAANYPGVGS